MGCKFYHIWFLTSEIPHLTSLFSFLTYEIPHPTSNFFILKYHNWFGVEMAICLPISDFSLPVSHFPLGLRNVKCEVGCGKISKPDILEWEVGPPKVGSGPQTRILIFKSLPSDQLMCSPSAQYKHCAGEKIPNPRSTGGSLYVCSVYAWYVHAIFAYVTCGVVVWG